LASIWLTILLVNLYGLVFLVILQAVVKIDVERLQMMLLGYVVPTLAAAVYLEDLWVLWKPRSGYMNVCASSLACEFTDHSLGQKMDIPSRFLYLQQMWYVWWLKIRKDGDWKDC